MAVKEILVDDINGDEHATTVPFSVRDKRYEIDLGKKGEKAFDEALKQFIGVARVVNGENAVAKKSAAVKSKRRSSSRRRAGSKAGSKAAVSKQSSDADELRAWAKANGYQVAERGRISADVRQAFEKAKAEPKTEAKPPVAGPQVNGSELASV